MRSNREFYLIFTSIEYSGPLFSFFHFLSIEPITSFSLCHSSIWDCHFPLEILKWHEKKSFWNWIKRNFPPFDLIITKMSFAPRNRNCYNCGEGMIIVLFRITLWMCFDLTLCFSDLKVVTLPVNALRVKLGKTTLLIWHNTLDIMLT